MIKGYKTIKSQNLLFLLGVEWWWWGVEFKFCTFEREKWATKIEKIQTRGSKIWAFCDNVVIECPLNIILFSIFFPCELFSGKKVSIR